MENSATVLLCNLKKKLADCLWVPAPSHNFFSLESDESCCGEGNS